MAAGSGFSHRRLGISGLALAVRGEREFERGDRAAGQVIGPLRGGDVARVLLGAAGEPLVIVVEPLGDRDDLRVADRQAGVDQERDRRRAPICGVQHLADDVQVAAQHIVVVGL